MKPNSNNFEDYREVELDRPDYHVLLTFGCLAFGLTGVVSYFDVGKVGSMQSLSLALGVVLVIRAMVLRRAEKRTERD